MDGWLSGCLSPPCRVLKSLFQWSRRGFSLVHGQALACSRRSSNPLFRVLKNHKSIKLESPPANAGRLSDFVEPEGFEPSSKHGIR